MKKITIDNPVVVERLQCGVSDRLYPFVLAHDTVRGAILCGTRMVNEMRANHHLGILETLVLGRTYLGAALMSAGLKGNDRFSVQIECAGPVKGLVVEANAKGEVRGYLKKVPIPIDKPMQDFDLAPFFGPGFLSVVRHLEDAKHPFTGRVILQYGNVAQDLAYYYLISEQLPTAFNLSIQFDREGHVIGAGGLFLQAMPEAEPEATADLERLVPLLPSLGQAFADRQDPYQLVATHFQDHGPRFLPGCPAVFHCHCSRTRIRNMLAMLPVDDLRDLATNGPFPLEIRCHYCGTPHMFDRPVLQQIFGMRYPHN
jgi:molecular chaperone Hsp33